MNLALKQLYSAYLLHVITISREIVVLNHKKLSCRSTFCSALLLLAEALLNLNKLVLNPKKTQPHLCVHAGNTLCLSAYVLL